MAVDVVNVPAFAVADKKRIRIVRAVIAGYAERQTSFGSFVRIARARRALLIRRDFVLKTFVHHILRKTVKRVAVARP
jgi:hypothetical protein